MKNAFLKEYMSDKYNFLLTGEVVLIALYLLAVIKLKC